MKSRRLERAHERLQREISTIISSMKDSRIHENLVTVSNVYVSGDFSLCKAYISCLKGGNSYNKVCKILNHASGYIQSKLVSRLKMRTVPKLLFIPNSSEEYAFKMNKIFDNFKINKNRSLSEISEFLKINDNYCIYTHEIPDGDAIGSSLALFLALKQIKKNVKIVFDKELPEKFDFIFNYINEKIDDKFEIENRICLDVSDKKRIYGIEDNIINLCIDHHNCDNFDISNIVHINKNACACSEIIYDLLNEMNVDIDRKISTCIYIGISSDTGRFKYSNVTSRSFDIVSKIFDKIDRYTDLNYFLSGLISKSFVKFQSELMKTFEFIGSCCFCSISSDLLDKYKIKYSELDSVYHIPLKIKDVDWTVFLKQKSENIFKASVRSLNNGKSLKFCKIFNGGGHSDAAGFEIEGDLETVKSIVLKEINKEVF